MEGKFNSQIPTPEPDKDFVENYFAGGVHDLQYLVSHTNFNPLILTDAQNNTLKAVIDGRTAAEIAAEEGVTEATVLARIFLIQQKIENGE